MFIPITRSKRLTNGLDQIPSFVDVDKTQKIFLSTVRSRRRHTIQLVLVDGIGMSMELIPDI